MACPLYYLCNIVGIRFVQIRLFIAVQQYWEMGCLFYIYFTFGHYFVWRKKVNGSTIDKHKIALKTVSRFVHTCKTHVSNNLCVKPTQQATRIHILPMILLLFLLFSILFGPLNRATAIVYLVNICLSPPLWEQNEVYQLPIVGQWLFHWLDKHNSISNTTPNFKLYKSRFGWKNSIF